MRKYGTCTSQRPTRLTGRGTRRKSEKERWKVKSKERGTTVCIPQRQLAKLERRPRSRTRSRVGASCATWAAGLRRRRRPTQHLLHHHVLACAHLLPQASIALQRKQVTLGRLHWGTRRRRADVVGDCLVRVGEGEGEAWLGPTYQPQTLVWI
jgi:hypothetical protein